MLPFPSMMMMMATTTKCCRRGDVVDDYDDDVRETDRSAVVLPFNCKCAPSGNVNEVVVLAVRAAECSYENANAPLAPNRPRLSN